MMPLRRRDQLPYPEESDLRCSEQHIRQLGYEMNIDSDLKLKETEWQGRTRNQGTIGNLNPMVDLHGQLKP